MQSYKSWLKCHKKKWPNVSSPKGLKQNICYYLTKTYYLKYCTIQSVSDSVTRLGDFLSAKFLAKVAQIISHFLGYFEKLPSYVKRAVAIFWVTFVNIWATFYPNIWHSYWLATTSICKLSSMHKNLYPTRDNFMSQ